MAKNQSLSILTRLRNIGRETGRPTDYVLRRYAAERLLYRIGKSSLCDDVILKGGILFFLWSGDLRSARPTMDTDFLFRKAITEEHLRESFKEICSIEYDDALRFDMTTLQIRDIRAKQVYGGFELKMTAFLGTTRIPVQMDIGLGDNVTPVPRKTCFPKLLDEFPAAEIFVYPKETFVAEKVEAIVSIGLINSRMKDFYDLWSILQKESFASPNLKGAIMRTFTRRKTILPSRANMPICFTADFFENDQKQMMWNSYLKTNALEAPKLEAVVTFLREKIFSILE